MTQCPTKKESGGCAPGFPIKLDMEACRQGCLEGEPRSSLPAPSPGFQLGPGKGRTKPAGGEKGLEDLSEEEMQAVKFCAYTEEV